MVLGALKLLVQGFFFFFSLTNETVWDPENAGFPSFTLNVDAGRLLPSSRLHHVSIGLFSWLGTLCLCEKDDRKGARLHTAGTGGEREATHFQRAGPDSWRPVAYQAPLSMGFPRQEYWSGWGAIAFSSTGITST